LITTGVRSGAESSGESSALAIFAFGRKQQARYRLDSAASID
jgi:hypothetical protein